MSKLIQVKVKHEKFNPETGEFYEVEEEIYTRLDVPFRSITDLKGFIDDEINTSDSLVDETGYEPLEHLIQRMQRGDISALLQGVRSIYGDVKEDTIDAQLENGILTIIVPKETKEIPAKKYITIK